MANWPALSPTEQQEKLAEITQEILPTLPHGWVRLVVRVKMIGMHSEADTGVKMPDGTVRGWSFTPDAWRKFQQLRKGMYAEGLGSWIGFEYVLDPPGRYSITYNRDEAPKFDEAPSAEDFATEQDWFPRSEEQMPEWFRRGLAGAGA
ncbi:hypothetical protein V1227_39365 [Lentzea sp. DG1S-22]|uniref:hypothetical protein n=1 Tax=Lentzea sp. DG1S-22 TaxID=3108822 RepID=UPI002E782C5F|nr:hypothetical protein [Lentzea sp. DG1S-22]WVH80973.1 hypothetical protein V1227_39365 [Lentzea sp. DG1S-22]